MPRYPQEVRPGLRMDASIFRIATTATLLCLAASSARAEPTVLLSGSNANFSPPVMPISYRTRAAEPLPRHHQPSDESTTKPKIVNSSDAAGESDAVEAESAEEAESDDAEEETDEDVAATLFAEYWHRVGSISAEYLYTGEVFNNTRGGISTNGATRYRGNFDLTCKLDTEKANWWTGGEVFVYLQQSHGETLSQNFVGDGQYYSNIDTSPKPQQLTQLGEYWYQHKFADDALSIRLGRQDANAEFAFADLGGDFLNSSFVTLPNIPMPFWPFQTLGVSGLYQANEQLRLGGGAYDSGRNLGQWWVDTTSRGMFFIGQADYQPFADQEESRLSLIRLGAWYTSSDTNAVDGSRSFEGNYGFYAAFDQMLCTEADDAEQGLGAFFQFSWAPGDRNQVPLGYGAGLLYRGLLEGRDEDTVGAGFTLIEFSSVLKAQTGQTYENAVELFYKAQLRDWLTVQPDMQYIARPFGFQRDALVVGVRFEANF